MTGPLRVLILGFGTLGEALSRASWIKSHPTIFASRTRREGVEILDVTEESAVQDFFNKQSFDVVINTAAMTGVDDCEKRCGDARKANALAVKYLAEACVSAGAALVHMSTDYVFSGGKCVPYEHEDATGPCSVYGATKLEGEFYALDMRGISLVVRSTWIFGGKKRDFVRNCANKFRKHKNVTCVDDQTASPTYAPDLAEGLSP